MFALFQQQVQQEQEQSLLTVAHSFVGYHEHEYSEHSEHIESFSQS